MAVLAVSAAGPLSSMVGSLPLALALGNGPGLPGAFVFATVVQLCFCAGYAALCRRVVSTGALYTYVGQGLGRPAGVGAAMLALLSYTALSIGLVGAFGYFTALVLAAAGVHVPWVVLSGCGVVVCGLLGHRSVDLSARVLLTLMAAEVVIAAVFDLAVLADRGSEALPTASFAPGTVFSSGIGISLMIAFSAFVGFESAALYGEETADPTRNIPRAVLLAGAAIGLFFVATSWITIGAIGVADTRDLAGHQLGNLLFFLSDRYAPQPLTQAMAVVMCTSLLAALLAVHNAASRYTFALGREGILPRALGRLHPDRLSPANASLTQTVLAAGVVTVFAVAGLDPYLNLATSMVGLATLGILTLQAFAAVAIPVYFHRHAEAGWWRTRVAPALGAAGLITATTLSAVNYRTLVGTTNPAVVALPGLLAVAVAGGIGYGLWLRGRRPDLYEALARSGTAAPAPARTSAADAPRPRYCIVGAGAAGLIAARSLQAEDIDYDQFERNTAAGGFWDPANQASPFAAPLLPLPPLHLADLPGHPLPVGHPRQDPRRTLRHLRSFSETFGLDRSIEYGVAVVRAEPAGENARDGWRVTLTTGETRHYTGVLCAHGADWRTVSVPEPLPHGAGYATLPAYGIPYLDEALLDQEGGRPQLYLNLFHPRLRGLYVLGFLDAGPATHVFYTAMARTILVDIRARHVKRHQEAIRAACAAGPPDLGTTMTYLDLPGRTHHLETDTYWRLLNDFQQRFGEPDDSGGHHVGEVSRRPRTVLP
nr:APC family permease [Streptomyces sp. TLI_235]